MKTIQLIILSILCSVNAFGQENNASQKETKSKEQKVSSSSLQEEVKNAGTKNETGPKDDTRLIYFLMLKDENEISVDYKKMYRSSTQKHSDMEAEAKLRAKDYPHYKINTSKLEKGECAIVFKKKYKGVNRVYIQTGFENETAANKKMKEKVEYGATPIEVVCF